MKNSKIEFKREYEKPIKVFGKQLKITRLILIASVAVLYAITLYFEIRTLTPIIFGIFPAILLILSIFLLLKRIIYIGSYNFECSNAGDIYLTKIKAICPKCQGELKIEKGLKQAIVRCKDNPNHTWNLEEK